MPKEISIRIKEIVNSVTHGAGLGLSIAALVLMIVQSSVFGTASAIVSAAVFGTSLIFLYTASTLYHSAIRLRLKYFLNKLDHSAIYILIAGTYTPYTLVTLKGPWGWSIFGIIWGFAVIGVIFKLFFYKIKYRSISAWAYVAMGLVIIVAIQPLIKQLSNYGLIWLAIGGCCYIIGVFFYLTKKMHFAHAIFHIFCIAGSFAHFYSIYYYVLPNTVN